MAQANTQAAIEAAKVAIQESSKVAGSTEISHAEAATPSMSARNS